MSKKLTTKEFIEKSRNVHGDKYDYSLVDYKVNTTKVKIICYTHGIWEQSPNDHLGDHGCPSCAGLKRLNNVEFIEKSRNVHGDKYDYSLVDYGKNNHNKIKIICPSHGMFEQQPNSHLNGRGCKQCGLDSRIKNKSHNINIFIEKAKNIHVDKYDYSLSNYKNSYTKIKIICPLHGEFEQIPNAHLQQKQGCPICNSSKGELKIKKLLDKHKIEYLTQYKFLECKYKLPLKFDFYLPKYNTCIEYDGEQHFKPIEKFGGKTGLNKNKKRDKIKNNFCHNNNIKLIRIKYNDSKKMSNIINLIVDNTPTA
jgi:hypothetical protein